MLLPGPGRDAIERPFADEGVQVVDDQALLAALRGDRSVEEVCRAAGITAAEFGAARDKLLGRRLPLPECRLEAAVGRQVEILRDRAGVPHVCADTTLDCYYGLGFAMAQDRLWLMDYLRRKATGRLAEILGPSYLEQDFTYRVLDFSTVCARNYERLGDRWRAVLDGMAAGINRAIASFADNLPVEFDLLGYQPEPW